MRRPYDDYAMGLTGRKPQYIGKIEVKRTRQRCSARQTYTGSTAAYMLPPKMVPT
jgi:hypothetical protein